VHEVTPGASPGRVDPDVAQSALRKLFAGAESAALVDLAKTARLGPFAAGETLYEADRPARVGILIRGLLRTVVPIRDGRRATVHYLQPGGLFGLPTLFQPVALTVDVVRPSTVLDLDPATIARVALDHPRFGWLISAQLAAAVGRVPGIVDHFGFKTVRQRVAGHLLALATRSAAGGLVVRMTQQELADSVGSVRTVVARSLLSLRAEGMVAIAPAAITILQPDALRRLSE
jgi:CRP/FNR family cyclic AMP-dependent transcriptional regulator